MKTFTYVIGDIHGCFEELLSLEKKIKNHATKNKANYFIVSVGDLIDRGKYSYEVIEYFKSGEKDGTHKAIIGNHEIMMLQAIQEFAPQNFGLENNKYPDIFPTYKSMYKQGLGMSKYLSWKDFAITNKSMWISQGGHETLKSFGCNPQNINTWKFDSETINFLIKLPFYWENEKFVVTHALALSNDLKLFNYINQKKEIDSEDILNLQKTSVSLIWNRKIPKEKIHDKKIHVSGHTPLNTVKRLRKANAIQIDTSCVFGGRLTALCLDKKQILSVKSNNKYPNLFK